MMREINREEEPYLLKPSEMEKLEMTPLAVLDPRVNLPPNQKNPGHGKKEDKES